MNENRLVLVEQVKVIIGNARSNAIIAINQEMVYSYWQIGKLIVEHELSNISDDATARMFILELSKTLSDEIGKGFSRSNLYNMRSLYLAYPDVQTLSGHLSWSHYCELLAVSDLTARGFYEHECLNSRWSVRELRRQIDSSLFHRLLLSGGDTDRKKVMDLARFGHTIENPRDIIKEPYVLEFLGLPESKPTSESDLEKLLISKLEEFLLELGRGFMFVGTQQRITINNTHYYVDMVFYNKLLKAYVLIDLKIGKFRLEHAGQMNGYVNYYKAEVSDPDDNPPIGIILCADKDEIVAEYALGGLENQVFASKYTYYIPDKEQLVRQVQFILDSATEA